MATYADLDTNNTYTALSTMAPDAVRKLWQRITDVAEQTSDFFQQFEGQDANSPIRERTELSAGAGATLNVTVRSGYYGPGKSGDSMFSGKEDFESDMLSTYNLTVDYLRNAVSLNERTEEIMGMRGEIASGQVVELGNWMGRQKTARAMSMYVLKGGTENLMYAGGKTSEALLTSADGLSWNDIVYMGQGLKPLGGRPAQVATINGVPVLKYIVVGTTPGLFSLKQDDDYKAFLKESAPRESWDRNPLFQGGYAEVDGHSLREYNPIDHDGPGPIGCAWSAKAFLGAAITAGTSTFDIKGGGSAAYAALTNRLYFRDFPNYAYEFLPSDIITPGTAEQYLLIINPKGAATSANPYPGKIGMYAYTTGNTGNLITITKRLAPVQNGPVALASVGSVTWNTGVWAANSGMHTQVHPIGSTIVLCNALGQPIGDTVMFGAEHMLRGYGKHRNTRTQEPVEAGFQQRNYITSVFGQSFRKNVRGVIPGYIRLRHAISYPELGIPTVT
jgi:hypothetical protein